MGKLIAKREYVPDAGDIVWFMLYNTEGHEQKGIRPAVVVTSKDFNSITNMLWLCPMTTSVKDYIFHVKTKFDGKDGVVMIDQLRSVNWRSRKMRKAGKINQNIFNEIKEKIKGVIN